MGHFKDNKKIPEISSNYSSCLTRSKPETEPSGLFAFVSFLAVLWIRIQHFKWIRIQIRSQGFDGQKLKKKIHFKKFFFFFFWSKIAINLFLSLNQGQPSYRRSPQLSKENVQHFKKVKFNYFFLFSWVILAYLDTDPIRIWIHNTGSWHC